MPRPSLRHGGNTGAAMNLRLESKRAPLQFAQSVGVQMRQRKGRGSQHVA